MKNIAIIVIAAGFTLMAFSCKEEKTNETEPPKEITAPVAKAPVKELTAEEKQLKKANKETGWIMQDMEVPEYKLDKLYKKGEFSSEDFLKYAKDISTIAKKIKDIDHPEEKFVTLASKMLAAMGNFEAAVSSKNEENIKSKWESLTKACAACHKDYKKGGGGY